MIVLVCGGRHYDGRGALEDELSSYKCAHGIELLIHGGASGADSMAEHWANRHCIPCLRVPADWRRHGLMAGPIRNVAMLEYKPDIVLAFPGGAGTRSMIQLAERAGVKVRRI